MESMEPRELREIQVMMSGVAGVEWMPDQLKYKLHAFFFYNVLLSLAALVVGFAECGIGTNVHPEGVLTQGDELSQI